jgi:hypothetical protein
MTIVKTSVVSGGKTISSSSYNTATGKRVSSSSSGSSGGSSQSDLQRRQNNYNAVVNEIARDRLAGKPINKTYMDQVARTYGVDVGSLYTDVVGQAEGGGVISNVNQGSVGGGIVRVGGTTGTGTTSISLGRGGVSTLRQNGQYVESYAQGGKSLGLSNQDRMSSFGRQSTFENLQDSIARSKELRTKLNLSSTQKAQMLKNLNEQSQKLRSLYINRGTITPQQLRARQEVIKQNVADIQKQQKKELYKMPSNLYKVVKGVATGTYVGGKFFYDEGSRIGSSLADAIQGVKGGKKSYSQIAIEGAYNYGKKLAKTAEKDGIDFGNAIKQKRFLAELKQKFKDKVLLSTAIAGSGAYLGIKGLAKATAQDFAKDPYFAIGYYFSPTLLGVAGKVTKLSIKQAIKTSKYIKTLPKELKPFIKTLKRKTLVVATLSKSKDEALRSVYTTVLKEQGVQLTSKEWSLLSTNQIKKAVDKVTVKSSGKVKLISRSKVKPTNVKRSLLVTALAENSGLSGKARSEYLAILDKKSVSQLQKTVNAYSKSNKLKKRSVYIVSRGAVKDKGFNVKFSNKIRNVPDNAKKSIKITALVETAGLEGETAIMYRKYLNEQSPRFVNDAFKSIKSQTSPQKKVVFSALFTRSKALKDKILSKFKSKDLTNLKRTAILENSNLQGVSRTRYSIFLSKQSKRFINDVFNTLDVKKGKSPFFSVKRGKIVILKEVKEMKNKNLKIQSIIDNSNLKGRELEAYTNALYRASDKAINIRFNKIKKVVVPSKQKREVAKLLKPYGVVLTNDVLNKKSLKDLVALYRREKRNYNVMQRAKPDEIKGLSVVRGGTQKRFKESFKQNLKGNRLNQAVTNRNLKEIKVSLNNQANEIKTNGVKFIDFNKKTVTIISESKPLQEKIVNNTEKYIKNQQSIIVNKIKNKSINRKFLSKQIKSIKQEVIKTRQLKQLKVIKSKSLQLKVINGLNAIDRMEKILYLIDRADRLGVELSYKKVEKILGASKGILKDKNVLNVLLERTNVQIPKQKRILVEIMGTQTATKQKSSSKGVMLSRLVGEMQGVKTKIRMRLKYKPVFIEQPKKLRIRLKFAGQKQSTQGKLGLIRIKQGNKVYTFRSGLTFNRANALAGKIVDNNKRASFEVKAYGRTTKRDTKPYVNVKFRLKKGKNPLVQRFVEKRKYRIDTKGEKQDLSIAKLYKKYLKRYKK